MKRNLLFVVFVLVAILCSSCYAQNITGTYYFPDKPFPQYMNMWSEGWSFTDADGETLVYAKPDMPLGGYAFIYFKNRTSKPIKVTDLSIEGIKMSEALGRSNEQRSPDETFKSSILISDLPKEQIEMLKDAGWPVWWKPEPSVVEPGEYGEITIRMKRASKPEKLNIGIITEDGTINAVVTPKNSKPQFGTIAFSPDLKTVYLYARTPKVGVKPTKVFFDGVDMTSKSAISFDKSLNYATAVISLPEPLKLMSYHNYKIAFADGSDAQAGIRSWGHDFVYGMWSSPARYPEPEKSFKSFIDEYAAHNINCVMPFVVGSERNYFDSDEGWEYCESKGMGRMITWPHAKYSATLLFAMDEPDASDSGNCPGVEPQDRLGMFGQWLVDWTRILHKNMRSPVLLNIDNTYKPENWYTYHQLCDVPCVDPYYAEALGFAYWKDPGMLGALIRPTYVQGVVTISQSAGQPKPLHVILYGNRYNNEKIAPGRYPTPQEKRMEVYYSIGSGAKGISYWWFVPGEGNNGVGENRPDAKALWNEIGLMGAEVGTASPIIATCAPVDLKTEASRFLWVRTLLSGKDTIAVVAVNDNVACDRVGVVYKPVENAKVSVAVPSWINPKDVFEVSYDGIKDVKWSRNGVNAALDMGTVDISKFVVITSNPQLKAQLQKRYEEKFAANVAVLKAEKAQSN